MDYFQRNVLLLCLDRFRHKSNIPSFLKMNSCIPTTSENIRKSSVIHTSLYLLEAQDLCEEIAYQEVLSLGRTMEPRFVLVCQHAAWPSDYTLNNLDRDLRVLYARLKDHLPPGLLDAYFLPVPFFKHLPTTGFYVTDLMCQTLDYLLQPASVHCCVKNACNHHSELPKHQQQSLESYYPTVHGPDFLLKHYTKAVIDNVITMNPVPGLSSIFELPKENCDASQAAVLLVSIQQRLFQFKRVLSNLKQKDKKTGKLKPFIDPATKKKIAFRCGTYSTSWLLPR